MFRTLHLMACTIILFLWGCNNQETKVIYVSDKGNDAHMGSLEKPLLTIEEALGQAKAFREKNPSGHISIRLREGAYYLDNPLLFTPELNGKKDARLFIEAYDSESPVISGGQKLHLQWEPFQKGIYRATLEEDYHFEQLFVNGERAVLARYPDFNPGIKPLGGFAADADQPGRAVHWKDPVNGYIHSLHPRGWGSLHYKITGAADDGKLDLAGGWQHHWYASMHETCKYVENVFEELDHPGEWYLDRKGRVLYFYPPAGVDPETAIFEAPVLEQLLVFHGTEEDPVRNITVDGLILRHTTRTFMKTDEILSNSDWAIHRGGAVFARGTENVSISNCFFDAPGGNAVFFSNYNRGAMITGNKITGAGASGICLVGNPNGRRAPNLREELEKTPPGRVDTVRGPKSNDYPSECTVHDNLIHDIGVWEKQVAGVQISMASFITVSHNSIYNLPRAGINICDGTWGGHLIEFNDVFNTVLETSDHGAFNSWGRDRFWTMKQHMKQEADSNAVLFPDLALADHLYTTVIRNNRFRCDHGWDIDLDDGSSNYNVYNNLCLNGGIKLREGTNRNASNNILVNGSFYFQFWYNESRDVILHNIVTGPHKPVSIPVYYQVDYNFHLGDSSLMMARSLGVDQHGASGDPLFKDPFHGDFNVKEGSPALALGFENFPMDQFGVINVELKKEAFIPPFPEGHLEATTMTMYGKTMK